MGGDGLSNASGDGRSGLFHEFTSVINPLLREDLFAKPQPMELEIGCGDGGFLFGYAGDYPDRQFVGVERLLGRLRKLEKKAQREGFENLRLLRFEARYLVQYLLPANAFEAIHIYFPDPWPKDKHAWHRLVNKEFPEITARILTTGGVVHLRTDAEPYFSQMQEVFSAHGGFVREETPTELAARRTEFEKMFNAKGIQTLRASWRLT